MKLVLTNREVSQFIIDGLIAKERITRDKKYDVSFQILPSGWRKAELVTCVEESEDQS